MESQGLLTKILIGFAITALTAMGAGVMRHEAVLTGIGRDIAYIRENSESQKDALNRIHDLLNKR